MAEDSLTRRLAGQSVEKAGLALDQSEISRIIAEASKGSKFYENERKKDEELTKKIEILIKKKEELMKGVDIGAAEASVDRMLAELEATRDLSQSIVHIDCDAFYASVEVLDDPSLAGKAFGVSPGVLTTASYEARKYGVRSAMPGFIAKKLCPHLIIVPLHFERYSEMSRQVMDVLRTRDPTMAKMSPDEAYLNVTEYCREHDMTPEECVRELRAEVHEKTKLTVSAGIAPNKMLAKICSDKNKPNGQYAMPFDSESIKEFMRDLPIRKVPGIGKVSERLLQSFGIKTCGDIYQQRAVIAAMDHYLHLRSLLEAHLGLASNEVQPGKREERKSVGVERTFRDTSDLEFLHKKLENISASLEEDLESLGFAARTITLKFKLHTFKLNTRAKSCNKWITSKNDLFEIGKELLAKEWPCKLRLIGLQASHLKDLRPPEDKGIMKFLAAKSPPTKRRKVKDHSFIIISSDGEGDLEPDVEDDYAAQDSLLYAGDTDSDDGPPMAQKPNFFGSSDDDEPADSTSGPSTSKSKKPHSHSAAFPSSRTDAGPSKPPSKPKPVSAAVRTTPIKKVSAETFTCPICSRTLEMDNAAFNAHVDFCLSKGAIMQASVEGDGSKRPTGNGKASSFEKKRKRANPFQREIQ